MGLLLSDYYQIARVLAPGGQGAAFPPPLVEFRPEAVTGRRVSFVVA